MKYKDMQKETRYIKLLKAKLNKLKRENADVEGVKRLEKKLTCNQ